MSGAWAIFFAILAVAAGLLTVTRANAARAVVWLLAMLLALAGAFFALASEFAAAIQILVYAGAVVAVFVFVLITVDASRAALALERERFARAWRIPALIGVAVFAVFVIAPRVDGVGNAGSATALSPKAVGVLLFGPWALAVEAASFLLLAGLIGVRHIGARNRRPVGDAREKSEGGGA